MKWVKYDGGFINDSGVYMTEYEYMIMINQPVDTGREALCVDNYQVEDFLTKGKRYKVYSHDLNPSIRVINDKGTHSSFSSERFQSLQDMREEKLKQLGI
jgi:hypothetical protein